MNRIFLLLLLSPALAFGAFDANGVKLGDNELAVKRVFPGIRCKPLEWKSDAAERRCDDARVAFAGVEARVTIYLKADSVQGFDIRFDTALIDIVAANLKTRYGKPVSESREKLLNKAREEREVYKVLWEQGTDKAMLSSLSTGKRAWLSVSRGNFDDAIYRIR
jgi:hypothetical protein